MEQTTSRLVFVNGPWQLLIAASALRQAGLSLRGQSRDTLVLCSLPDGPFSQSIRDVMERMATVLWPWRRVVMLDDAVKWWTLDDVRGAIESLRARLDEREPDELWMVSVPNIPAKIRAEAYPSAQIVFFEDGLHTYLPVVDHYITAARFLTEPRHVYHALKVRIRERLRPNDLSICQLLPRHRARVIANYTWISLVVPPPDYQTRFRSTQIQTSHVRETLELVTPMLDDVKFEFAAKPRAVLLGQCFSNYGAISRETELELYVSLARELQEKSYEVLWKEHPRTRRPFLPDLIGVVPGVSTLPDLGPWPIELFVERLGLSACAGICSTSLFSIPLLYNLPAFSPAKRYVSTFPFPDNWLAQIVADSIARVGSDSAQSRTQSLAEVHTP